MQGVVGIDCLRRFGGELTAADEAGLGKGEWLAGFVLAGTNAAVLDE